MIVSRTDLAGMLAIWWCFWMVMEAMEVYIRWRRYWRLYGDRSRWIMWVVTILYIFVAPGQRIWMIIRPFLMHEPYRVQIDIIRRDGRNAKIAADIIKISDGEHLAVRLMEGDSSISAISYQVVKIYDETVLEASYAEDVHLGGDGG